MKRILKVLALACACAIAALTILACSSPEVSRSSTESLKSEEPAKVEVSTDPIYVLLIGNDSRYGTAESKGEKPDDPSYSDTIMLMRLDPKANRIGIVSIPRDTAAEVDGKPEKINAVHLAHGPEALAKEIGSMFGVEVPYYFDLKFIDFAALVDKMGGITVDVPKGLTGGDILSGEKITLNAGTNELNGASALMLSRQRKVYAADGEAVRQMLSRDMVANAIQRVASDSTSDPESYAKMIESVGETNMSDEQLVAYIKAFIENGGSITFNLGTITYSGGIDSTGFWRIARNPDEYAAIKQALESGGDLTAIVPLPAAR